jgi:hypothetical protein
LQNKRLFCAILVLTAENQLLDKTVHPTNTLHNPTKTMKIVKSQSFQKFIPIILMCSSLPFFAISLAQGLETKKACSSVIVKTLFSNSCSPKLPDDPKKAV